jgi:hypothetical protein
MIFQIHLGILLPVYNEAENIGETLTAIHEKVRTPHRISMRIVPCRLRSNFLRRG